MMLLLVTAVACRPVTPAAPASSTGSTPAKTTVNDKIPVTSTPIDLGKVSAVVTAHPVETVEPVPTADSIPTTLPEATVPYASTTDAMLTLVKEDLAQKIGVSVDKINVREMEAVEWSDGSLGCGKPGTEYLQVVTPGFLITLEAEGKTYPYHTNRSNQIILCSVQPPHRITPTP